MPPSGPQGAGQLLKVRLGHFLVSSCAGTAVLRPCPEVPRSSGEIWSCPESRMAAEGQQRGWRAVVWTRVEQAPGLSQEMGVLCAHASVFIVGTQFNKDFVFKILLS